MALPKCEFCEKTFSAKSNLLKHIKVVHKLQKRDDTLSYMCNESDCKTKFVSSEQLRNHLNKIHNIEFQEEHFQFENWDNFILWKNEYEEKEDVNFVKFTGVKKLQNGDKRHYFNYHRSGPARPVQNSVKITHSSHKLGFNCTSTITAIEKLSGQIICIMCSTHYGHSKEIGKLNLTENQKRKIASKLSGKVDVDNILKEIRDDLVTKEKPSRIHLTTKQDIKNVKRKYKLNGPQRHQNDATSVSLMINDLEEEGDNPIITYKFQGEKGKGILEKLNENDIFFVIQHSVQRVMLEKFGQRIVCIDSTHGTNRYGFNLITLLTVDEYEEGFPVAFCLCNREDSQILNIFFSVLKGRLSNQLEPTVFMSDDAPAFYNAWQDVFGAVKHKLLCAWHVERALRLKLQSTIKNKELLCKVYQSMCLLLEETNQDKFKELYENIKDLFQNKNVKEFGEYFLKTYGNKIEEIAACYRINLGINTNMHLESFHRIFKYNFLKAKTNNRMDLCIFQILEFIKNIALDRIKKLERGKLTNKMRLISNRHRKSLEIDFSSVDQKEDHYVVNSCSTDNQYSVKVAIDKCHCKVKCHECCCCIHEISCTCEDFLIRNVVCKHCHLVMRKIKLLEITEGNPVEANTKSNLKKDENVKVFEFTEDKPVEVKEKSNSEKDENVDTEVNINIIHEHLKSKNTSLEECEILLQNISQQLHKRDPKTEIETIKKACRMLKDVNNFLAAGSSNAEIKFPVIECKGIKIKTQRYFYATKKRSGKKKNKINKATPKEKENIHSEILNLPSNSTPEKLKNTDDHVYCTKENISTKIKSHPLILTRDQQKLLKKILNCDLNAAFLNEDAINVHYIKNCDNIQDSIIDFDLSSIKKLLTDESLSKLEEIIEKKKENWHCSMCSDVTTKRNMVQCDVCLSWIHFECTENRNIQENEPFSCCQCLNKA